MNVTIIGTGALGSFCASRLHKAGAHITLVARSDFVTLQTKPVTIHEEETGTTYSFTPDHVVKEPSSDLPPADYVILCTKVLPTLDRPALLRGYVTQGTSIVLLCNGMDVEEDIRTVFPENEIISALAFICVTRLTAGEIRYQSTARFTIGTYPSGISDKVLALANAFQSSGFNCTTTADIIAARWEKCVWNAAFNPLSVISQGLTTLEIVGTQEEYVRAIMAEVCAVANADGHPLPENTINSRINFTKAMAPYKTSMLLDFEEGRPMETEAILGNTVRKAASYGVPTPHLDCLYAILKLLEVKTTSRTTPEAPSQPA